MPDKLKELVDQKDLKNIKNMIDQYKSAQNFWNSSPESDDTINRQRRTFVITYQEDIQKLYQATYGKRAMNGSQGILVNGETDQEFQERMKGLGIQGILEDYQWMLEDNEYRAKKAQGQVVESEDRRKERRKHGSGRVGYR